MFNVDVKNIYHSTVLFTFQCIKLGGFGVATRQCYFDEEESVPKWGEVEIQECGEEREVDLGDLPEVF